MRVFILLVLIPLINCDHEHVTCHADYYKWPQCINHADGYGCECGPGFFWNTHMCVALGINSYFEFSGAQGQVQYVLLLEKPFPELDEFTISLWLRPRNPSRPSTTIMSYSHSGTRDLLKMTAGPTLRMELLGQTVKSDVQFNNTAWTHIAWAWKVREGSWQLFVNGRLHSQGELQKFLKPVPGGGDLVLGQASSQQGTQDSFNSKEAFIGDMGFVNIWSRVLDEATILRVYRDCFFMECGDAIEWADFRQGTRGSLRVRWPSRILDPMMPCFRDPQTFITCDRYCSLTLGAQCNAETVENIAWLRTKADENATMPCPTQPGANTTSDFAVRKCRRVGEYDGEWELPDLRDCVSPKHYSLLTQSESVVHSRPLDESRILKVAADLVNLTEGDRVDNVLDISAVIDSLEFLLEAQNMTLETMLESKGIDAYGLNRERDKQKYPTWNDTLSISQKLTSVLSHVMRDQNEAAWALQKPRGVEGDQLLQAASRLLRSSAKALQFHVARGDIQWQAAELAEAASKIAFQVKMYRTVDVSDIQFPHHSERPRFGLQNARDYIVLSQHTLDYVNDTILPDLILISMARYDAARLLPNHDIVRKTKDDNVNSAIFALGFHQLNEEHQSRFENLSYPVTIKFQYLDNFNISNPLCVRLKHTTSRASWNWTRTGCQLIRNNTWFAWCRCYQPGIYAVLTDMYDDNWDPGEEPLILMAVPSYIGCSLSSLMCLFSALMLVYLRSKSNTSTLHKHFALSIIGSQCSFMFGINRVEHKVLCEVCAVTFHYFFLATFSWLMNEAFNLYIVITYAAHSHGEHAEGGSQWRYYILGWVLPGILVGAFVGAQSDKYYAPDMCWIAWEHVWLFLGPAIGIISVTILVMIFTAKEHHESSYSKSEKTNNQIAVYSKALWTQIILLTVCWSFAFLTIKMRGVIIKWIYALFNTIQGAFFVVFYFLLNDEVRTVYKANVKKNNLNKMGYDYSPAGSADEDEEGMELAPRLSQVDPEPGDGWADNPEPGSSKTQAARGPTKLPRTRSSSSGSRRKAVKCGIETSDEESTAEMDAVDIDGDDEDEDECDVILTTTV